MSACLMSSALEVRELRELLAQRNGVLAKVDSNGLYSFPDHILISNKIFEALPALLDALEQQESALLLAMREQAQREWIPVSERLPEPEVSVLIYVNGFIEKTCWYNGEFLRPSKLQPTHWQPLPLPPLDDEAIRAGAGL